MALSVDPQSEAQEPISKHGLTFPVAYGIDAQATATSVGNSLSDGRPTYSHATGFVLSPDGKVAVARYSSSAVGRLNAADTMGLIRYMQSYA